MCKCLTLVHRQCFKNLLSSKRVHIKNIQNREIYVFESFPKCNEKCLIHWFVYKLYLNVGLNIIRNYRFSEPTST